MTYDLERRPARARRLAVFFDGAPLELVEIPFGPLSDLWISIRVHGLNPGRSILAATLHVDGAPIGLEALDALPGRLSAELVELMQQAMRMHAMDRESDGPEDDEDDDDGPPVDMGAAPPGASPNGAAGGAHPTGEPSTRPT
jgi:hypothetical protein